MAREEGRAVGRLDRWLDGQLFASQSGNLAAPPTSPEANATIRIARSRTSRRLSVAQVASSLPSTSPGDRLGALAEALSWRGSDRQANG